MHQPWNLLKMLRKFWVIDLASYWIDSVGTIIAITFHLWSHAQCNSFYSIGCWLNYLKFPEHLESVSRLVHAQYQNILKCSPFTRAVWVDIVNRHRNVMRLFMHRILRYQVLRKSIRKWVSNSSLKIWSQNFEKCGRARSHENTISFGLH